MATTLLDDERIVRSITKRLRRLQRRIEARSAIGT
jgi:hypothetical protein